jgi:serine/threonine protein kinase
MGCTESQMLFDKPRSILEHYIIEDNSIGKGAFGAVRTAKHRITGEIVAVKSIPKTDLPSKAVHDAIKEAKLMKSMEHPNIVRCIDFFNDRDQLHIVMEYLRGGNLVQKIIQRDSFDENQARDIIKAILSAINYCHERGIVHRDIKPDNLLLSSESHCETDVKLADFGLAVETKGDTCMIACGTPHYIAPEIVIGVRYGRAVDIWALGVTTYVLLCGKFPFNTDKGNETSLFKKIRNGTFTFSCSCWMNVSDDAKDLIRLMMTRSPTKRITAAQALAHPWMTKPSEGLCCRDLTENLIALKAHWKLYENRGKLYCTIPSASDGNDQEGDSKPREFKSVYITFDDSDAHREGATCALKKVVKVSSPACDAECMDAGACEADDCCGNTKGCPKDIKKDDGSPFCGSSACH